MREARAQRDGSGDDIVAWCMHRNSSHKIDMGCDVKCGYCMKMDARGEGSSGDMQKRKRGTQHVRGVHMMMLDCVAVHGSMEIADGWTLTTEIIQKCLHKHSSM